MFIVEKIAVATPRLIAITIKAFNRLLESYFEAAAFRLFRVYSRLDVMTMSQDNEAAPWSVGCREVVSDAIRFKLRRRPDRCLIQVSKVIKHSPRDSRGE